MNYVQFIVTDIVLDLSEHFTVLFTAEDNHSSLSSTALQHETDHPVC
jgi:hypothetical protein